MFLTFKINNMKIKRKLSGIYFRSKNEEIGKFDNIVFEDLSEKEQDEIMNRCSLYYLKGLVKQLANTLNDIGNQLDIIND